METEQISKEDLLQWIEEPVSRAFIGGIKERLKELFLELGNGKTLNTESSDKTLAETAKLVGQIEVLQEVLDMDIVKGVD